MHQSIVRTGTIFARTLQSFELDAPDARRIVAAAERAGLASGSGGDASFSSWIDQVISPASATRNIVEELQQLARSLLIFGMHIHVPCRIADNDRHDEHGAVLRAALAGAVDEFTLLDGRNTGLKSFRTTVFRRFRARHSRAVRIVERLRKFCKFTGEAECIDYRQKDLVD